MKTLIKYLLHTVLGFGNYLFLFSRYKIYSLRKDKKEGDFFFFLKMLPDEGTVLDIGANIGIMTVHLARNSHRKVIAFEPMPHNLEALRRVIAFFRLDNIQVIDCALGNENGTTEMIMPMVGPVRMQGLSHVVHDSIQSQGNGERIRTRLCTLDSISELKAAGHVTGIKMDVENFEYYVLDGGKELLRTQQPLLYIELWDNGNRQNCFRLLKELGYAPFVVEQGRLVPFTNQQKQNFIFRAEN
jgi:FkbM family methyltransferase